MKAVAAVVAPEDGTAIEAGSSSGIHASNSHALVIFCRPFHQERAVLR